jgi:hypothetical protein
VIIGAQIHPVLVIIAPIALVFVIAVAAGGSYYIH